MKKQFFGALALVLMISVTSCKNENKDAVEENVEEVNIQDDANLEVKTDNIPETMEAEITADSLNTTKESGQETPQI
ncbi:hypothetical protein [Gramella sp. MAR_2010_147]|uniref:hypothetical protein n=1 Tax=Gramella sp. MAR_2010_147 TaxID=1250205 RepID=UPI00087C5F18|nr:hypothetical protein [Gramella sp. MAR_2010_147]SDS29589.1 hypothetical protein SAMN04488553_1929 [Gramella sp. MAR_2010_147]